MPYRKIPFVAGETYHVFNRSVAKQPIFKNVRDYQRAMQVINFYRFSKRPFRFSYFNRLSAEQKIEFMRNYMTNTKPALDILAYCIMPNHIHFLLHPFTEISISDFMRKFQNSYSKYFNTKYNRTGSLFQGMFKAVRIESDEQFIHVSRYIHLNPVSSYIVDVKDLENYQWSSFKDYLSGNNDLINPEAVLSHFSSIDKYRDFVFDQAEYQRTLENIKHLILK